MSDTVQRSTTFELFTRDEEAKQAVINAVRSYRSACRQAFAIYLAAHAAGADVSAENGRITPNNTRAAKVLLELFETRSWWRPRSARELPTPAYDLRQMVLTHLLPDSPSWVWDSLRRDVVSRWKAKDPEFTTARRGWLTLNGARGTAEFRRCGIPIPAASKRFTLEGHDAIVNPWKTRDGVRLTLWGGPRRPKVDSHRWFVWRSIRDGDYRPGTIYLNERDGRIIATISYAAPATRRDVDPSRVMQVRFSGEPDSFLRLVGPDGVRSYDSMSAEDAIGALARLAARRASLERRRAACGSPRAPWGHRKGWLRNQDVLSRVTLQRTRLTTDINHAWSRRIADRAVAWRCGSVIVSEPPETLFEHSWPWLELKQCIGYKCSAHGIVLAEETA